MPGCALPEFTGREVIANIAFACGDVDPSTLTFMPIGAMTTKSFELSADTVSATSDKSVGGFNTNFVTYRNATFSADGFVRRDDDADSNVMRLTKHWANPEAGFNNQPVVWLELIYPDLTFYMYSIVSSMSREAPTGELVTFSAEFSMTSSPFGLIIEDTPQAPDSITATPATVTIAVAETEQLSVSATPAEASTAVNWLSSNPAIATVNSGGLVTGVAEGSATITATSILDGAVTDTVAVTVDNTP
jgi:predicted secreted protein